MDGCLIEGVTLTVPQWMVHRYLRRVLDHVTLL
jgi:hypothetical protein